MHSFFEYKFSLTGHQDSIKDLSFTSHKFQMENGVQYLASCSQDQKIRLWKIQPLSNVQQEVQTDAAKESDPLDDIEQYQSKTSYLLKLSDDNTAPVYNVALESVLINHQSSVSSVEWAATDEALKRSKDAEDVCLPVKSINDLQLLSSSFDFTVCLWNIDEDSSE